MRHLYGTALAVILAAAMFFAGAWGYVRLLALPVAPGQTAGLPGGGGSLLGSSSVLLAMAAVVGTAVLAGLLATIPVVSPLATGLPGAVLLAWTALYLVSVRQAVSLIPLRSHAFGAGWEAMLFNGILAGAGAVLIFPMLIPSRWRTPRTRRARARSAAADADELLKSLRPEAGSGPRERAEVPGDEQALVGTVLPYPAGHDVSRVDTTRVTGASRALRATGSFNAATGAMPRATRPTPRDTGSFRGTDTSLLGQPYEETHE